MVDTDKRSRLWTEEGGTYALFVDDELPADQRSLEAFRESKVPGVVIRTTGSASARLVYGDQEFRGNRNIRDFLARLKQS